MSRSSKGELTDRMLHAIRQLEELTPEAVGKGFRWKRFAFEIDSSEKDWDLSPYYYRVTFTGSVENDDRTRTYLNVVGVYERRFERHGWEGEIPPWDLRDEHFMINWHGDHDRFHRVTFGRDGSNPRSPFRRT